MTGKEKFMSALRGDKPLWIGDPWECFNRTPAGRPNQPDAISAMIGRPQKGDMNFTNAWGITYIFPEGQPAPLPHVTAKTAVVKDIENWRDELCFPSLDNLDWTSIKESCALLDRSKLTLVSSGEGMFEFSRSIMGFEECLINYLTNPEDMYDMLAAYTDWKIEAARIIIEEMKPDVILNYDDWGSNDRLFLPPDVWRKVIKPHYSRFYKFIHDHGALVMHHCDCYAECIAHDMVDVGIDIWQGVTPENNILQIISETKGKLMLLGGIDMTKIDFPNVPEFTIRQEIDRAIESYAVSGHFLPCFTSILPIHNNVALIGQDEMNKFGYRYVANESWRK